MADDATEDAEERPLPYYDGDVRLDDETMEFLLRLHDTPAPSGFEEPAAELVTEWASGWADDVRTDAVGNVHVVVNPGAPKRVLVTGHIDEIGFLVQRFEPGGQLRFEQAGGWDLSVPAGQRVLVLGADGPIPGTVGKLAPHQMASRASAPTLKDLWIDIGAATKEEAEALVRVGDPVVLDASPHVYDNRRVITRSADDRIGALVALEVARRAKGTDVEVVALCATREEIGLHSAGSGAFAAEPDAAIAIDVTFTSDVPGDHSGAPDVAVGKGPAITFGATTRVRLARRLVELAHEAGIDIQLETSGRATYTDGDAVAVAGPGIPTGVVSVPTRYLHSPGELFALEDVEACIDLLGRWVADHAG